MIEHFDEINWPESDVLGWTRNGDRLVLFVDVYLTTDHPEFASGGRVDDLSSYYRRAKLIVSGMNQPVDLPSDRRDPRWNEARARSLLWSAASLTQSSKAPGEES